MVVRTNFVIDVVLLFSFCCVFCFIVVVVVAKVVVDVVLLVVAVLSDVVVVAIVVVVVVVVVVVPVIVVEVNYCCFLNELVTLTLTFVKTDKKQSDNIYLLVNLSAIQNKYIRIIYV